MKQQRQEIKLKISQSISFPQNTSLTSMSLKPTPNLLEFSDSQFSNPFPLKTSQKQASFIPYHNHDSQVQYLLKSCDSHPSNSFLKLFQYFEKNLSSFTLFLNPTKENQLRRIFSLIFKITKYHNYVPFVCQLKIVYIFQNIFQLLAQDTEPLTNHQILTLQQTCIIFWNNFNLFTFQVILQNLLTHLLQFSILLSQRPNQSQLFLSQRLFSLFFNKLLFHIEKHKTKSQYFKDILCNYVTSSFTYLLKNEFKSFIVLPLYDILALSLTSQNHQFFKNLFSILSQHLQINKFQIKCQFPDDQDIYSLKDNLLIANKVFYSCSYFNFSSIFSSSGQSYYSLEIVVYLMIYMKQTFFTLIEELEKIQKSSIPQQIIVWNFNLVRLGNSVIKKQSLNQVSTFYLILVHNIIASPQMYKHIFQLLRFNVKTENQEQYTSSLYKTIQQSLFQLFYKIQKLLSHFNLQIFKNLYIENPQTFRSSYFIQNLFKLQHSTTLLSFMIHFTQRWLLVNEKKFDFQFYLLQFFDKCISKDNLYLIGEYYRSLSFQLRIKISLIVYKMSFHQQIKKIVYPQPKNFSIILAQLTSVGFSDKFLIVSKLFPNFSEQLVMKQIIQNFLPSQNYFTVKAFFHVIHYEFDLVEQNFQFLGKLIDSFQKYVLQRRLQQAYSIFHHVNCISFRDRSFREQYKRKFKNIEIKMLRILLLLHNDILTMCEITCSSRREAISHLILTQEMINSNFKYFQKIRRMHSLFLKNVVFWFNQLINIQQLLESFISFQEAKQIYQRYSKQVLYPQFRFLQNIQIFCSQKHFSNILQTKIKQKMLQRSIVNTLHFSILQEVVFSLIKSEEKQQFPFFNFQNILEYFGFVLETKLNLIKERQILKKKLFILQFLHDLLQFFTRNPENHYCDSFVFCFTTFFKKSIIEIALQNPDYVEKYQKELIINLRIASIQIVLLYYKTKYQTLRSQQLFSFLFESCFDKNWQIRLMLLNIFTSRFKSDQYASLLQAQNYIITYLTHFAIFQPQMVFNIIAKKIIEHIKNIASDESFLGLNILLYSMKLWFSWLRHQVSLKKYDVFFETFLKAFTQMWLTKKEWEYQVYVFYDNFVKNEKIQFILQEANHPSNFTPYIIGRIKSDFQLENILKKHLQESKKFQFQPSLQKHQPKTKRLLDQILYSLSVRFFLRIKQLIEQKPRSSKILKSKKDILINWKTLQQQKIVVFQQFPEQNYQLLDSFLKID